MKIINRFIIFGLLSLSLVVITYNLYDWYLTKKLYNSSRESIDAFENCMPLLDNCRYLDPRWQLTGFDAKKDADLQVLQKYENAIENCIKPLSVLKRSNNQNFKICYEKNTYFRNKVDEMEKEILSGIDSCKARLERKKEDLIKFLNSYDPTNQNHLDRLKRESELIDYFDIDVKPFAISSSFLEGKSAEEIFEMYEDFVTKYDKNNKVHHAELSRRTTDPLFLALKNDENWVGKIEELEKLMWAKHKSKQ
jgi:hypothetical protein